MELNRKMTIVLIAKIFLSEVRTNVLTACIVLWLKNLGLFAGEMKNPEQFYYSTLIMV